jgi:hypothetical protein
MRFGLPKVGFENGGEWADSTHSGASDNQAKSLTMPMMD